MAESSVESLINPLAENSKKWASLDYQTKLNYLYKIQQNLGVAMDEWSNAAAQVRNAKSGKSFGYLTTGGCSGILAQLIFNYQALIKTGKCRVPPAIRTSLSGKTAYQVFPIGLVETAAAQGLVGEVFLEKEGQTAPNEQEAGVCAILAPGNFEAPNDILSKLFVENKVCVWKPHAVNEKATLPFVKKAFEQMIQDGYLVVIEDSSPKSGAEMINAPVVTEVLMTGGAATYDRIVWGPPEQQAENKENQKKVFSKKFDAELGAVSPVLIVPGIWTDLELEAHAESLAMAKIANGGAICASPQVIIVDEDWPQREKFINLLKEKLNTIPRDPSYYPGASDRQEKGKSQAENTELLGQDTGAPVLFLNNMDQDSKFCVEECFALAISEVRIKGENDPKKFVDLATDYANNKLFGTLSCSVLCPPDSEKAMGGSDYATEKLNYGAIGFNCAGMQIFFYQSLPWGGYPGHKDTDIQSGIGKVNNAFCFTAPAKSVLKAPFINEARLKVPKKDPTLEHQRVAQFMINPGFFALGKVISASLFNF